MPSPNISYYLDVQRLIPLIYLGFQKIPSLVSPGFFVPRVVLVALFFLYSNSYSNVFWLTPKVCTLWACINLYFLSHNFHSPAFILNTISHFHGGQKKLCFLGSSLDGPAGGTTLTRGPVVFTCSSIKRLHIPMDSWILHLQRGHRTASVVCLLLWLSTLLTNEDKQQGLVYHWIWHRSTVDGSVSWRVFRTLVACMRLSYYTYLYSAARPVNVLTHFKDKMC